MSRNLRSLLFLLAFLPTLLMAQTGTIRGFVYDKQTGEPIIFTNVILKGTTIGAATDVNGYYSISKVTPGSYTLQVTFLGYDTAQKAISVTRDQIIGNITKDIALGEIPDDSDCANAVAFLCSDYARVITGAGLDVNGGEFMP